MQGMHKARRKGERGGHNYKQGGEEGRKVGRRELGWWTFLPQRLPKYDGSYMVYRHEWY